MGTPTFLVSALKKCSRNFDTVCYIRDNILCLTKSKIKLYKNATWQSNFIFDLKCIHCISICNNVRESLQRSQTSTVHRRTEVPQNLRTDQADHQTSRPASDQIRQGQTRRHEEFPLHTSSTTSYYRGKQKHVLRVCC